MKLTKSGGYIYPKDKKDMFLFKHCSGGMDKVKTREFNSNVKSMLFSHGVYCIEITPFGKE